MEQEILLVSVLIFLSIAMLCLGAFYLQGLRKERTKLIRKIKGQTGMTHPGPSVAQEDGTYKKYLRAIATIGIRVKPGKKEFLSGVRDKLVRSGYSKENDILVFFGFKAFFAALLPAVFLLIKFMVVIPTVPLHVAAASIIFALIGFYLPNVWCDILASRRKEMLLNGFPDALDLMVVCVEAGMGLDAAIHRVGEELKISNEAISKEFWMLGMELRVGKSRREALQNLAKRMDLEEARSLASLLIQTDRFGTNIAQALRVHAEGMRVARRQKAEELATKLPVKLIFPLLLFIFPSLIITILGPATIQIYRMFLNK